MANFLSLISRGFFALGEFKFTNGEFKLTMANFRRRRLIQRKKPCLSKY